MNEYKDLYTEDIEKASVFRRNYLESVLSLSCDVAEEKKNSREEYISPEKLKNNREKYLADFKELIGDPFQAYPSYPGHEEDLRSMSVHCDKAPLSSPWCSEAYIL